jgi:hypothetical protein
MMTSRRRLARTPILLSALTLGAVLNTAGCFGGDDSSTPATTPPATPGASTTSTPTPADVALATLSGRLTKAESTKATADIGAAVVHWFDGAYLTGDYPRDSFGTAFGSFTVGAAALAGTQRALMSNAAVGSRIDTVTPAEERVRLDLIAVDHKVVGATARIRLVFRTEGSFAKTVTVAGKVFLTPGDKGGWRIFGYHIARGEK